MGGQVGRNEGHAGGLGQAVAQAVAALDFERVRREYWEQEEFVFLERFLPPAVVAGVLVPQVERLRPHVHRSYLPRFKKGGSISAFTLAEQAPEFLELYRSPALLDFLSRLVGTPSPSPRRTIPTPARSTSTRSLGTTSASTTTPSTTGAPATRSSWAW